MFNKCLLVKQRESECKDKREKYEKRERKKIYIKKKKRRKKEGKSVDLIPY